MPGTNSAWDTIAKPEALSILGSDEWPALTSNAKAEVKADGYSSDNSTNYESEAEGTCSQSSPVEQLREPTQTALDAVDGLSDAGVDSDTDNMEMPEVFPSLAAAGAADGSFGTGCQQTQNGMALCAAAATHSAPPGLKMPLRSTAQAFVPRSTTSASTLDFMAPPPGLRKPLRANASAFVPTTAAAAPAEG
mmetsp:Transcript_26431/g.48371  ORF Transcript_26431/g.48371 Transcript_26431/m.48371 type:complete len:192 (+) Transcript_26431:148-723(+)